MLQNKKVPSGALLLAGVAAFAYYKYSKMSAEEKQNLVGGLKEKGQKLYDQYAPQELKDMLKGNSNQGGSASQPGFGDGGSYSS